MYCSKCGVENSDQAIQCINCGSPLAVASDQMVQPDVRFSNPPTSGLAIASLVMAILSLFCSLITSIPALICGIMALSRIKGAGGRLKGRGMAVAGVTISCIMMFVIPVLVTLFMPALSHGRRAAERVLCNTNLQALSVAMIVYSNDYNDTLPMEHWCDLLIEEADVSPKLFICRSGDAIEGESAYAMNKNLAGIKRSNIPHDIVVFFETDLGVDVIGRRMPIKARRHYEFFRENIEYHNLNSKLYYDETSPVYEGRFNQIGGPEDVVCRHRKDGQPACNVVYADGRVETVTEDRIAELQWTVE